MIEAGEVGAVFRVVNQASAELIALAEQFERLDGAVRTAKGSFDTLRIPPKVMAQVKAIQDAFAALPEEATKAATGIAAAFEEVDAPLLAARDGLARSFAGLPAAAREAALGVSTAFEGIDARIAAAAGAMATLNAESAKASLKPAPSAAAAAVALRPLADGPITRLPPHAGGGGRGGGGGGHHGGFRLGGGIPIDAPGGGHMHMSAGGPGFWTLLTGLALGEAAKKFIEGGFALRHQVVMIKSATADAAIQAAVLGKAWQEAGSNVNSTVVDNISHIMELNKATGNWTESMKLLHTFNVAEAALGSVKDQKLKETMANSSQTLNFARGLEELGATSRGTTPEARDAETKKYANDLLRTMIWSRGRFDGNMLFGATNNSGGMAQNWDEQFATTIAPIMALEMKGSKLGNMDYMAIKSLVGGHITSSNVEELLKNKLITPDETFRDKHGLHLKPNSPDMIKLMNNPWDWANDELASMKARGVDTSSQKVMADLVTELANSKTLSTGLRMLLEPAAHALIAKDIAMRDLVPPDAASVLMSEDPAKKLEAVSAKWNDLMASLGGPITDKALAGLAGLANTLSRLAQFFNSHPKAADLAANATADAAGVLTVGGALMMTKFARSAFGWLVPASKGAAEGGGGGLFSSLGTGLRGGAIGLAIDVVAHQLMDAMLGPKQQYQLRDAFSGVWPITDMFFRAPTDENLFWPKGGLFDGLSPHSLFWHSERDRVTSSLWRAGYKSDDLASEMGRESSRGRALGALGAIPPGILAPVGHDIEGALGKIPGQVQPAISGAFASIGGALSAAISGLAGAAGAAKAISPAVKAAAAGYGIPGASSRVASASSASGGQQVASNTSAPAQIVEQVHVHNIHIDGYRIAKVVTKYQTADVSFPTQAPYHDTRAYPSAPDIGYAVG